MEYSIFNEDGGDFNLLKFFRESEISGSLKKLKSEKIALRAKFNRRPHALVILQLLSIWFLRRLDLSPITKLLVKN